jgi:tetratricopeptide (TPR) repeat protein
LDNTHALSYFLMGSTLAKLGEREAAAKHFEQARALDPKFALRR